MINYGLLHAYGFDVDMCGYTNADWAGKAHDKRSTSGHMFSFGSVVITWSSKNQPIVAPSSTEAEYQGAVVAAYMR